MSDQILDEGFSGGKTELSEESISQINLTKIDINENIKHIKNGRTALIVLGVFAIISIAIGSFYNPYEASFMEIIIEAGILAAIYAGCAIGVKFNPRNALIIGFSFYMLVQLLYLFVDATTLYKGLIVKIIIIYFLVKAMSASFQYRKDLEKLYRLGVPMNEIEMAKNLETIPKTPRPN